MTKTKTALYAVPILAAILIGSLFVPTFALIPPNGNEVEIDIKPGSDQNSINPNSRGVVPVAILGSADFDVTQIDPDTIMFTAVGDFYFDTTPVHFAFEDVNDDGLLDLIAQFLTQSTGITCDTELGEIIGFLVDGAFFFGIDSINPVGKDCVNNNEG